MDLYSALMKIFSVLGIKKGYYGEFTFKFEDGNLVHFKAEKSLKANHLEELLNRK